MLYKVFKRLLEKRDLYTKPFLEPLMRMSELYTETEVYGAQVDINHLVELKTQYELELIQLEQQFLDMSHGEVSNAKSSAQIAHYFYDSLKLPNPRGKEVKPRSTSKIALDELQGKHPAVDLLRRHRRVQKMVSSYIVNVYPMLDEHHVAHFDTKIHGTEVGRLTIKNPALQTIPRADDKEVGQFGTQVKALYCARPGHLIWVVDSAQAEMRGAAALSLEPFLMGIFERNEDIHSTVAAVIFGPNFTKAERSLTKYVDFSYLYGGNEYSVAGTAGVPLEKAAAVVRGFQKAMPRLAGFREECGTLMRRQGFIRGRTGRCRRFPYINEVNADEAKKAALHSIIAGPVSDITNIAAYRIQPKLHAIGATSLFTVHDSIIGEVPFDVGAVAETMQLVSDSIINVAHEVFPEVPWKVEGEVGYNWGEVTRYNGIEVLQRLQSEASQN